MRMLTGAVPAFVIAAAILSGCNSSNPASGISTASLLDGKSSAGGSETPTLTNLKPDDPKAKAVQVAWTAARAQKCGYNFDAAKLKASYLASEVRAGAAQPQIAEFDKTYDTTFATVSTNIKADDTYCGERKTAAIKADLQRHLAGNYTPNMQQEKKVAGGGFLDGLMSDAPPEKFDSKNFWGDQMAKRDGAKGAQRTDE
jgi:aerobic-type carbon monoxide dehydrogenase small subunit (CoxS/CutS family)